MFNNFIKKYFNIPQNFFVSNNLYLIVATFFGAGYAKKAPGTVASALTLVLIMILNLFSSYLVIILTILFIIVGFFVCNKIVGNTNNDPSYIVIDEVAGMFIALLLAKNNIILCLLGFIIFRILDIKKPSIIGYVQTNFNGASGVMLDDILAGFITMLILTGLSVIFNI
jgi:phosphatidylglycerophosphatase A